MHDVACFHQDVSHRTRRTYSNGARRAELLPVERQVDGGGRALDKGAGWNVAGRRSGGLVGGRASSDARLCAALRRSGPTSRRSPPGYCGRWRCCADLDVCGHGHRALCSPPSSSPRHVVVPRRAEAAACSSTTAARPGVAEYTVEHALKRDGLRTCAPAGEPASAMAPRICTVCARAAFSAAACAPPRWTWTGARPGRMRCRRGRSSTACPRRRRRTRGRGRATGQRDLDGVAVSPKRGAHR